MAFSLIANTQVVLSLGSPATTPAVDTTGANLTIRHIGQNSTGLGTVSDSKGNTDTALTNRTASMQSQLYYCLAPTVGSGHTFTDTWGANGFGVMQVQAWSGADSFDVENGVATNVVTHLQTGSVTPNFANSLVASGMADSANPSDPVADTGFTISDKQAYNAGVNYAVGMDYQIQTSIVAINHDWTWGGGTGDAATTIAVFKAAAAAGGLIWIPPQQRADNLIRQIQMIKTNQ